MAFPERIAIASHNPHKLREIAQICHDWPVDWVTVESHDPSGFPIVEETEDTYVGNALLKARAVAAALELPSLADDSGIEVDALGGRPGVHSAYFAGPRATDEQNLETLIRSLKGVPRGGRVARYRCIVVLAQPDGSYVDTEGVCEGTLEASRRGVGGFGYDPIFVPAGWDQTMAELSSDQKDRISHRGRAFRAMQELLATGSSNRPT